VLALLGFNDVNLPTTRRKGTSILSPNAEEDQFSSVSKIEADAATIRTAVLSGTKPVRSPVREIKESQVSKHLKLLSYFRAYVPVARMRRLKFRLQLVDFLKRKLRLSQLADGV